MRVYFDNAATTPLDPKVLKLMTEKLRDLYGNPSSIHQLGRSSRSEIEKARKITAEALNASTGEIFFTSGGTESNNMAIKCAVRDLGIKTIITSPIEHYCVLHTVDCLENHHHIEQKLVKVDEYGHVQMNHLEKLLEESGDKTLVSLMHANNEIGTMTDIEKVGEMCREHGVLFHSDTIQTVGHFPIDVSKMKIDFLSGSAHKLHGPKGVGFLYINSDNKIDPFLDGGGQERNMRGGTENLHGIIGLGKALELAVQQMEERKNAITAVRDHMKTRLMEVIPEVEFKGDQNEPHLYTVLSVSFPPGSKTEMLPLALDIEGICASGGSACSSGSEKGSHVMDKIGEKPGRKTIRFSFSHFNTKEEVNFAVEKIAGMFVEKGVIV
ncbi:MAG: cysteine desulfurase [Saprospirales bacterium]|nr:MAG: cysteine desulfurase [Saprospirales bacterium]